MNKRKGFTLIEVILVLAIAALIILMVLLTLPAVQRVQRDNERRQHAARVVAAAMEYMSNTGQMLPHDTSGSSDVRCYGSRRPSVNPKCVLDPYLELPDWLSYVIGRTIKENETNPLDVNNQANVDRWVYQDAVKIYNGAVCDTRTIIRGSSSQKKVVAVIRLEQGAIFCTGS